MVATMPAAEARGARNEETRGTEPRGTVSKLKLALGAASLFLFIVGVKRSFAPVDAIGEEQQEEAKHA